MCRNDPHYAAGTVLARQGYGISSTSSRSHRVLGRTMSSRRSPPRGNSGGFAFDMVADPPTMLAPVLDEDLVGVEPGGEHAGDVRSEEHTSELQSRLHLVCRLLLEKKKTVLPSHHPSACLNVRDRRSESYCACVYSACT